MSDLACPFDSQWSPTSAPWILGERNRCTFESSTVPMTLPLILGATG